MFRCKSRVMPFHFIRMLMIIVTIILRLIIINLSTWNKRALMAIINTLPMPIVNRLGSDMAELLWRGPIEAMVMIKGLYTRKHGSCRLVVVILCDGRLPFFLMFKMASVIFSFSFSAIAFYSSIIHSHCFNVISCLAAFCMMYICPPWWWWLWLLLRREGWCFSLLMKLLIVDSYWRLLLSWLKTTICRLLMWLKVVHLWLCLWLRLLLVVLCHLFLCHSLLSP